MPCIMWVGKENDIHTYKTLVYLSMHYIILNPKMKTMLQKTFKECCFPIPTSVLRLGCPKSKLKDTETQICLEQKC